MSRTDSCEDRIDAELKHELDAIREAVKAGTERYLLECECGHEWESDDELEDCPECGSGDVSSETLDVDEADDEDSYDLLCPPYVEYIVVRAERSCGGPQDFWRLYLNPEDGEICRISYSFLDWWDGAIRWLDDKQFELVAELFQEQVRYLVEER